VGLGIAIDIARELGGAARFFGVGAEASEFSIDFGVSVGPDARDFGFELAGRGCLRRHARFLRGELAQRFGFELGLRLCESCLGGFLAQAFEIGSEPSLGFGADAGDFRFERAGRGVVCCSPRFLRDFVATLVGLALRFFLRAARLIRFDAQSLEFCGQS
jgi:hypothetical protein